ncbi:GvpL/GvpF family gas vesicle protein [Rhizohabitans arisaemae]|uniref:GvpL/GvpF family gas vesicle protein n=1 Tax=Rhizohabitans arisaemae TaxID=2720610 RepID=UPI0024B19581|nr:GvpL/GvpF family gas vesicle protein [Rhizohabitans arisaemae]
MTADTGVYLYAVAHDLGIREPEGLTGVDGRAVRVIPHADLVAYVSTVPLDRFGEEALRRSMEDLDWLDATARAHHHVVETVAEAAPVVPVRLVTVYGGEGPVKELLDRRHDDFVTVLARVTGRQEWGVKAYARAPASAGAPGRKAEEATVGPGTAYLRRRRSDLHEQEEERRRAAVGAERIHEVLAASAVASRLHRTQDPQLSGRTEWMVLNGAYLVDRDRAEAFRRVVDGLSEPGVEVQLTGPWTPYSFTVLDEADGERP